MQSSCGDIKVLGRVLAPPPRGVHGVQEDTGASSEASW